MMILWSALSKCVCVCVYCRTQEQCSRTELLVCNSVCFALISDVLLLWSSLLLLSCIIFFNCQHLSSCPSALLFISAFFLGLLIFASAQCSIIYHSARGFAQGFLSGCVFSVILPEPVIIGNYEQTSSFPGSPPPDI